MAKLSLPRSPSKVSDNLREYSILFHGEKKIGKTSLLAQEPDNFFMEFDPLQKALSIHQREIKQWTQFLRYLELLENGDHNFKTVTVDRADLMYQTCLEWKCKQLGVSHPSDIEDYGKTWNAVKREFHNAVIRLMHLEGMACRFITHSIWKEVKTREQKIEKLVPVLSGQAEEVLVGFVDIWAAYCYDRRERVLVLHGDEQIGAGCRVDHRFLTPEGKRIKEVPMGDSPQEAYSNLLHAFANKQEYATTKERRIAQKKNRKIQKK